MSEAWSARFRAIEKDSKAISDLARQTLKLLNDEDHGSPVRYQSVVRNAGLLKTAWTRHFRMTEELFPTVIACDIHFADFFDRMMDDDEAVDRGLTRLASAAWPRQSVVGMSSIRSLAVDVLTRLIQQLEREQATMLLLSRHDVQTSADLVMH